MLSQLKFPILFSLLLVVSTSETHSATHVKDAMSLKFENQDGIDPIITGPVDPKRMPKITKIDTKCDADCQAKRIGLIFED